MRSSTFSRRKILQMTGGAAAAGIISPVAARATPIGASNDEVLDVAVVGGGIAGLYSAWRLRSEWTGADGPRPDVTLFEGGRRIGGRLLSLTPPGIPGTRVELGGMRFASIHKRLASLVDHFGLVRDDFP